MVMSKRSRDGDQRGERKSDAPRGNRMTTRLKERKRPTEEESQNPRSKPRIAQEQKECAPMSDREKRARAAERRANGTPHVATEASKQATTDDFDARVEKFREGLSKQTTRKNECLKREKAALQRRERERERERVEKLLQEVTNLMKDMSLSQYDSTPLRF